MCNGVIKSQTGILFISARDGAGITLNLKELIFMRTKVGLKEKCLMLLVAMCLVLMTSCSMLTKQNPNVNTPLDAAKVTYDASCGWYVGVYSDVVTLNKDPYLSRDAQNVLRN